MKKITFSFIITALAGSLVLSGCDNEASLCKAHSEYCLNKEQLTAVSHIDTSKMILNVDQATALSKALTDNKLAIEQSDSNLKITIPQITGNEDPTAIKNQILSLDKAYHEAHKNHVPFDQSIITAHDKLIPLITAWEKADAVTLSKKFPAKELQTSTPLTYNITIRPTTDSKAQ